MLSGPERGSANKPFEAVGAGTGAGAKAALRAVVSAAVSTRAINTCSERAAGSGTASRDP